MAATIEDRIEATIGRRPVRMAALAGGCIAEVRRADFADGPPVVIKIAGPGESLEPEAFMLRYLRAHTRLPVPDVLRAEDDLLIMSHIESAGGLDGRAQAHAAELLADLHGIAGERFGFERDTLIGPLPQPNPPSASWRDFFRDQRLLHMGRQAFEAGRITAGLMDRLERLCGRLGEWIEEPPHPSLIHGDMWGGNVLACDGRIAGFVDPAIYYADAEVELAFSTLFGTFGEAFFARYDEIRPLRPGFFEARRDIYNLYPLLVHARLFGGGYAGSVDRTLARFGC